MPVYTTKDDSMADTGATTPTKKQLRPKSLAISTPTKLLSLEEARTRALNSMHTNMSVEQPQKYIEVGGGPDNLPNKYHTVIDLPLGSGGSTRAKSNTISASMKLSSRKNNNGNGNGSNGPANSQQQQQQQHHNNSSSSSGIGWKAIFKNRNSSGGNGSKAVKKIELHIDEQVRK